jgi:diadenosine tetraphosphatase ApaH/serine/threonine PP2A family protein phosphatase
MTSDQVDFLAGLPLRIDIAGSDGARLTIAHATPFSAHVTVLPESSEESARQVFANSDIDCFAYGHIHQQYRREVDGRLLTSVGAIGAPLDGDWRAAYSILTNNGNGWQIEFRRVPYDIDAAVEALLASSLPDREAIATGMRMAGPKPKL